MKGRDKGGGHGAGVRVEGLVAGAVKGDGEGVRDQHEDGGGGGGGGEDEGRAGVDDRLPAREAARAHAVYVHRVEGDLPVEFLRDGDLGEAALVSGGVPASEAECGLCGGPGCGASEVETEFGGGLE